MSSFDRSSLYDFAINSAAFCYYYCFVIIVLLLLLEY